MIKVKYITSTDIHLKNKKRVTYFDTWDQIAEFAEYLKDHGETFVMLKAKKVSKFAEKWNALCRKLMIGPKEESQQEIKVSNLKEPLSTDSEKTIPELLGNLSIKHRAASILKQDRGEYNAKEEESTPA